jgi:hypothetical protein
MAGEFGSGKAVITALGHPQSRKNGKFYSMGKKGMIMVWIVSKRVQVLSKILHFTA